MIWLLQISYLNLICKSKTYEHQTKIVTQMASVLT